jgi:hypothetical protein
MSGLWRGAVAGLIVLFGSQAIAGEPDDAGELIAKLKAPLGAIETVQATHRTYFSPKTPGTTNSIEPDGHPVPGAIAGPDDLILYSEFDWAWQAALYREAIDGKWGFVQDNRMIYAPAAFFFDGATLRTFNRDYKGGLIKPLDRAYQSRNSGRDPGGRVSCQAQATISSPGRTPGGTHPARPSSTVGLPGARSGPRGPRGSTEAPARLMEG